MTHPPTSGAADLPEALRVPLDSLHADAGYLCGRLLNGSLTQEQVVESIRRRIDAAKLAALTAQAISAEPAEHVQNPAEIEHVAGDVSKNGPESNTSTQQPAPATQQVGEVVAYLDVGANGYLDLGSELSEDALQQLPKGRHALVIAGTYGIDGYVATPQPSPAPQAADSQPAPEYVGNGMFKGETIEKAAEHWANWFDVRCMTGLSECLRVVAAHALADSVPPMTATGTGPKPVTDADVRNMSARVISGQAEEDELLEFFARLAPPRPVHIAAAPTPPTQADSVLEDAARLDFLIEQRAYVVSDPDTCPGYWLHFVHKETGKCWVQYDEHPTPRAAIDAAMKAGGAT